MKQIQVAQPTLRQVDVARQQFLTNLTRQAVAERRDREMYARWEARQPAIRAQELRERKILAYAILACAILTLIVAGVAVWFLMNLGVPLLLAVCLALVVGPTSGGCCCVVTVTVMH